MKRGWANPRDGNTLERWNMKINDCRSRIISWTRDKFKQRGWLMQEMMNQLGNVQEDWRGNFQKIDALSKKSGPPLESRWEFLATKIKS